MEDKIIVKSKRYNVKKFLKFTRIFGIVTLVLLFIFLIIPRLIPRLNNSLEYYNERKASMQKYKAVGSYSTKWGSWYDKYDYEEDREFIEENSSALGFVLKCLLIDDFLYAIFVVLLLFVVLPQALAGIIYLWLKSYELIITNKRAYGFAAFGKRVDLPLDSITAIGLGWLKSITITTASGIISFKLIKNRDKMYETISRLIVERQNKGSIAETVIKQENQHSNADELKKYKELLDSDIITQEEYDAKKKQ